MVFKTVIDNIRSFFLREEQLLQEPKQVPDAASEVLGDAQPVVEKPLPRTAAPQATEGLPFSAKELQSALDTQSRQVESAHQSSRSPSVSAQSVSIQPHEIHELESEYVSDDDLMAFEETMNQLPQTETRRSSVTPSTDGFFSSFEDFLKEGSLDKTHLDGDLLHKMRVFHQRRQEGKEPLLNRQSATHTLRRRLQELQSLEHEWERLYAESRDAERAMIHVEEEIETKTKALRGLLSESEHLTLLSREVPEDSSFVLANGVRVRSLGALLRAVRNDSWLFARHVSTQRNDFAIWVASAVGDAALADRLASARDVDTFLDVLRSAEPVSK